MLLGPLVDPAGRLQFEARGLVAILVLITHFEGVVAGDRARWVQLL